MMKHSKALFVLVLLTVVACEQPAPGGYDFSPQQADAVRTLLDEEPSRQILTASDNRSPMLAEQQGRQPGYEPYFARGDFDADGLEDFVVAVQEGEAFDLYVFRGTEDGYHPASWFVGMEWLPEAGLFVEEADRRRGDMVGVGSFSRDDTIWFGWNEEIQELEVLHSDREEEMLHTER